MRDTLGLFVLLSGFWGINSPNDSALLLFLGLLSVLLVVLITHRMKLLDRESFPLHLITRIFPFYLWLLKEIILGCLFVMKTILARDKNLTPEVVTVELAFKDELNQVIFANSLTLVPGTLSVELNQGSIQVHTLSPELAAELRGGEMARRIKRLEG